MIGPRPAGQPWTPAEDAQLVALLDAKMEIAVIAWELKRTVQAIRKRRTILNKRPLVEPGLKASPSHIERQFMERLQGAGWVKAFTLPSGATVIDRLLNKGWIEKDRIEGRLCYRMTDQGRAAKKMPVRIDRA
jgi:hypothetical protein